MVTNWLTDLKEFVEDHATTTEIRIDLLSLIDAEIKRQTTGEWIPVTNGRGGHECSACHEYAPSFQNGNEYLSPYCPNCGRKLNT